MRTHIALLSGFNAQASRMSETPLPKVTFRDPCAICRQADGTYDAHPHLRDRFVCAACFEAHVEPARLRIIERAKRWAAMG